MKKPAPQRLLFVAQDIAPYLPASDAAKIGKEIPQFMQQSKGFEVRTFMPKFGTINERRNQLHEVIRLSGLNIEIDNNDHPLILKVASMLPVRIQVYFIDNDDYFTKEASDIDPYGSNRKDNDERAIYFARGTMETVKKLRWNPTLVHASGWMSALVPAYLRKHAADNEDSPFKDAKYVYTVGPDNPEMAKLDPRFGKKLDDDGIRVEPQIAVLPEDVNMLHRLGIAYSDAVVFLTNTPDPGLLEFAKGKGVTVVTSDQGAFEAETYANLYESLKGSNPENE